MKRSAQWTTPIIATGMTVMIVVAQSCDLMMNTRSMSLICRPPHGVLSAHFLLTPDGADRLTHRHLQIEENAAGCRGQQQRRRTCQAS
jgi:hypothetical protein